MEPQRLIRSIFLSLWVLLLPFWDFGAGLALGLAVVSMIFIEGLKALQNKWKTRGGFNALFGIVVMVGVSALWHSMAQEEIWKYWPLIGLLWVYDHQTAQRALPIGAAAVMLYLTGFALWRWSHGVPFADLLYRGLLGGLHQHVYLGTYLLLGALAAQNLPLRPWLKQVFWGFTLLVLGLMGAKMLLLSALLAVVWFYSQTNTQMRLHKGVLYLAILVAGFTLAQGLSHGRALGHVMKKADPHWATGSIDTRLVQSQAAWTLIKEKPITGWGPRAVQSALDSQYTAMDYRFGLKRHLNVHNQFLQWGLAWGLFGFVLLMACFVRGYKVHPPSRPYGGMLVLYFGSLMLTESFMERALGISLLALAWAWVLHQKEASDMA